MPYFPVEIFTSPCLDRPHCKTCTSSCTGPGTGAEGRTRSFGEGGYFVGSLDYHTFGVRWYWKCKKFEYNNSCVKQRNFFFFLH